jgi:uncharacterized repeat protein (TIGR02543 family)
MVTITYVFGNGDNKTVDVIKKRRIGNRYDLETPSKKAGFIFEGWYTDSAIASLVTFPRVLNEDTVFYAKWGALADFDFVWTRTNAWSGQTSLLVIDEETGWFFEGRGASVYVTPVSWHTAPISLNANKTTLTLDFNGAVSPLTKQTKTITPEAGSRWAGFWANNSLTLDLKNDGFGEIIAISGADADDETLALAYAEGDGKLNLLGATSPHYVLLAIPITGGGLGAGFEQKVVDEKLLGFWEINSSGGKSAYEFKSNGGGTYYALGVEFTFNYVLTEEGDGLGLIIHQTESGNPYAKYLYEISDDGETLTVQGVSYSKLSAKPDYSSGSGGDTALVFRWFLAGSNMTTFVEFDSNGLVRMYQNNRYTYRIWKAASGNLTFFFPDIGKVPGDDSFPYQIATQGATDRLTFDDKTYEKSLFAPTSGGW